VASEVEGLRSHLGGGRIDPGTARERLDNVLEELYSVVEELQISNEELRLMVMELQFARSRYRDLFHLGPDARLLTDADAVIIDANAAAATLMGCEAEQLLGTRIADLLAPGGAMDAALHLRRAAAGHRGRCVWTLARRGGGDRLVEVTYLPMPRPEQGNDRAQWLLLDMEQPMFESEDRDVDSPRLARRWLNVYGELVAGTEGLLREATDRAQRMDKVARAKFEETQIGVLDARLTRLTRGLAFWRDRHATLVNLEFDLAHEEVRYRDRVVRMSRRERQLLNLMLGHPGQWFRARALMVQAWHSSYLAEEQLRTYIVRLRKKLEELDAPCAVVNRRGGGYALVFERLEGDAPAELVDGT